MDGILLVEQRYEDDEWFIFKGICLEKGILKVSNISTAHHFIIIQPVYAISVVKHCRTCCHCCVAHNSCQPKADLPCNRINRI